MRKMHAAAIALAAAALIAPTAGCDEMADDPAPIQPANGGTETEAATETDKPAVKLTAQVVKHQGDEYVTGGPFSCVRVELTNQSRGQVEANPFSFAITDTEGTKRNVTAMVDERELQAMTLAPGETAKGVVCAEGEFTPDVVSFDDYTNQARAKVSR